MADEACGSEEKAKFLSEYEDVNQFMQQTLRSVLLATKSSNEMPAAGDDFDYYSSFPGFQGLMNIEGKRILHVIQSILKHENVRANLGSMGGAADIEDKLDQLMDANDQILERVGTWLDEASGIKKDDSSLVIASATPKSTQKLASWNKKSPGSSSAAPNFRLLSAKNIQRPQLRFRDKVDNRNAPFRPIITDKPNALKTLEESLKLPEGVTPEMSEQPEFKHPHPYQYELDHLTYQDNQTSPCKAQEPGDIDETPCMFINTPEQLGPLVTMLKKQSEIAIDLEHHNYRTFQGMTCLMQISTRSHDYLIDTLELRSDLQFLNEVFTDPSIVKVLHGADSDIDWLQRDLGLYIVNMFDTGQAARVMNYSRFSLAHLLQQYCGVTADKQYQLADWRIRPLPEELSKYAREDTHYLLYVYDLLKNELITRGNNSNNLLLSVLNRSRHLCMKVYQKQIHTPDSYLDLYRKNKKVFNSQQLYAFKELFNWRDETARLEDESYGYVLPNHMMLQICDILPRERPGVLACCNPIPPLVRQYLNEIHTIIMKAREAPLTVKLTPVREKRPTIYQHPKYNSDSLLNCPHDLSHPSTDDTATPCVLDPGLMTRQSALFSSGKTNMIIEVKDEPLLTAFNKNRPTKKPQTEAQKKVSRIKASFVSPYFMYLPDKTGGKTVPRKSQMSKEEQSGSPWKLLPCSIKRKKESSDSPANSVLPTKRSRTDLQAEAMPTNKHLRFTDEGETIEITDDDKKALPQDLKIPIRFQVPSKKKKKNRNKDIDLIESVQEHLTNIRKIQEENETVLGKRPGDDQPSASEKTKKVKQKMKDSKKKKGQGKNGNKNSESSAMDTATDLVVIDSDEETVGEKAGGAKSAKGGLKTEVTIEIDDSDSNDAEVKVVEEFKPYDYTEGAKQLLKDTKQRGKGHDYYNPQSSGRGKSKNMRNRSQKKGQKSLSWKSKK
ncbi:exosome component 10-like [Mya arenaria]|uniref:exosome component 10-like n=1 Tax=Mya arenaria TaxID=6604 RepID=UPI0022E92205|nr:exosome component 10-like [Mya arenaria]